MEIKAEEIKQCANKPRHVAIILDGNGRWAKKRGLPRTMGHNEGVKNVKEIVTASAEAGIRYLTIYAFSKQNWSRPSDEVGTIMSLLNATARKEINELHRNNVCLRIIGDKNDLPAEARKILENGEALTRDNTLLTLIVALSYSSRDEILRAVRSLAEDSRKGITDPGQIDETLFESRLDTAGIPDPDLVIRTSGEFRISNYLLWQSAYAEFFFAKELWPDFHRQEYYRALLDYTKRERRFGKTSEQVTP
ncbi:MAG: isoprenyl transferase [bacterium]|jgi:undecaprenyl diphosphate synthase|nr:isoprenyl transferase [Candidatus Neomarinimicrobiota bacterium]MDX9780327.1 isoprenyl transferase [bacterium]